MHKLAELARSPMVVSLIRTKDISPGELVVKYENHLVTQATACNPVSDLGGR